MCHLMSNSFYYTQLETGSFCDQQFVLLGPPLVMESVYLVSPIEIGLVPWCIH